METRKPSLLESFLNSEPSLELLPWFKLKDFSRLSQTCKNIHSLFHEGLVVTQLLQYVAYGKQDEAEKLVKKHPALVLKKSQVTDYSLRTFANISPLQYAAWALDIHMLKMMLKYVSQEQKSHALQQLGDLDRRGTEHGSNYDFAELKGSLKQYSDFLSSGVTNYPRDFELWCNVGKAQTKVPAHVANEYCHPSRNFLPITPTFEEETLPRQCKYFDSHRDDFNTFSMWYPLPSNTDLGVTYAITRGNQNMCQGWKTTYTRYAASDLAAMTALCTVRTAELAAIKQQLMVETLSQEKSSKNGKVFR